MSLCKKWKLTKGKSFLMCMMLSAATLTNATASQMDTDTDHHNGRSSATTSYYDDKRAGQKKEYLLNPANNLE